MEASGKVFWKHVGVSKNTGTPKSSILIGFSIINHPFWGTSIFGNTHVFFSRFFWKEAGPAHPVDDHHPQGSYQPVEEHIGDNSLDIQGHLLRR